MTDKATNPGPPRTLMQAHEALARVRPSRDASPTVWRSYYERSAALYQEIAEIDRGHHHEALYWADREREMVGKITAQITPGDPGDSAAGECTACGRSAAQGTHRFAE